LFVCYLSAPPLAKKVTLKYQRLIRNKKVQVVETACGECQFKLAGKGCDLAVRIDGKGLFC
jgi:hypothetical protein